MVQSAPARAGSPAVSSTVARPPLPDGLEETRVCVLDADPDLGAALDPDAFARARRPSVARVVEWHPGGIREVPPAAEAPGAFGLLVLEGMAAGRFLRAGRTRAELLGPEDLLRPWVQLDTFLGPVASMSWEVLEPMRLAVLDRHWAQNMAPWPEVPARLLDRLVLRTRRLCFQMTAAGNARGEDRVRMLLWQLADQWGRVTPDGVLVDLRLSHRMIAELTGSTRPTVTSAVTRMRAEGRLSTLPRQRFVLHGPPPSAPPD